MKEAYLTEFLGTAYQLQRGEFFPEIHEKNLEELARNYPDIPKVLQDQLYRFTITLDTEAMKFAKRISRGELSPEEAIQELSVTFRYYSPEVIKFAIDWNS